MKPIITFFLLLFSVLNFAQDFQGKATYQSKTSFDLEQMGKRVQQMSEEQKKQMLQRMKPMLEKTYILTFNKSESVFKEEEKLEAPGQGGGWGKMMGNSFSPGKQYKNVKDNRYLEKRDFFGKQFLINEPLKQLDWKLGSETKVIGQYTCYKATAIKEVDEMDWRSMRRKKPKPSEKNDSIADNSIESKDPMSEIETPKTIVVTAWYTPQVPVSQGPSKYWGLPGLILEVNADRTTILCTKIVMNPDEKETIEAPTKGKQVTTTEYNEIIKKKMEEMREMYRGRRGGGKGFRK